MKGKLLFVAGAAVGYVLGARAGRARYEQIRSAAQRVWETPGIQAQVENAKDFAAQRVGDIPGALADGVKKVVTAAANRRKDTASSANAGSAADAKAEKPAAEKSAASKSAATKPAAKKPAAKKPAAKKPATKKPSTDA